MSKLLCFTSKYICASLLAARVINVHEVNWLVLLGWSALKKRASTAGWAQSVALEWYAGYTIKSDNRYPNNKMLFWRSHPETSIEDVFLWIFEIFKKTSLKTLLSGYLCLDIPLDTGRKLNVHKTFRRRPGHLLNVLCTFNLRPVSMWIF